MWFSKKKPTYTWESSFIIAAVTVFVGFIGSLFVDQGIWYQSLPKVAFLPPNWVFGPAWIFIYILVDWSAVIIANSKDKSKKTIALFMYGMNAMLNFMWSVFFFAIKDTRAAFMELILLWLTIVGMILLSARISKKAARLLLPYLAWVTFGGYLNYSYMVALAK